MLGAALLWARVAISLVAFSGMRIEVLGDGKDGWGIGDVPDLVVKGDEMTWAEMPARIVVRPALSKAGQPCFTFLGSEGVAHVGAYLRARTARSSKFARAKAPALPGEKSGARIVLTDEPRRWAIEGQSP